MAKHSVNVVVKAKDLASKKFAVIGASAKLMGVAFKSAAKIARATLAVAFRVVKRAAMGLAVAFAYCTYAALKQESAEIELASALKMAGKYSDETMQKLKAQAAAIQDVTTYGDEYVLSLMRIAMTLGVTADKSADAAKAAIALHAGYGGGRGKPEVFLRYYIDALQGTGSSLASYVVEMKKAKTEQGKLVILQEAVNKSWGVAKSKADSATGALKQMKNKLGDVAEAIARPFLPAIQNSAKAITNWAARNEATITWWAKKTYSYVTFIKDVFLDFAKFMREDWRAAFGSVFDIILIQMKAFGKSSLVIFGKIAQDIENRILVIGKRALAKKIDLARFRSEIPELSYGGLRPEARAYFEGKAREKVAAAERAGVYKAAYPTILTKSWEDVGKEIAKIQARGFIKTIKKIGAGKSWQALQERLEALGGKPAGAGAGAQGGAAAPLIGALKNLLDKTVSAGIRRLVPLESRFLTSVPGRFNYAQETARNTKEQNKLTKEQIRLQKQMQKTFEHIPQNPPELVVSNFA